MEQPPAPKTKFKLEIGVYFSTKNDLLEKLQNVIDEIVTDNFNYKMGCTEYNLLNTDKIEKTKCDVLYTEEPLFRFDEINGIECIVYQSRMNFDESI